MSIQSPVYLTHLVASAMEVQVTPDEVFNVDLASDCEKLNSSALQG